MRSLETGQHYPLDLDNLPPGWIAAPVGDALEDIHPGFPSGRHNQEGIGIPHLRPMNVDRQGRIDLSVLKYVLQEDGVRLRKGDVLFNNTNSAELIGKTAAVERDENWAFSNHMTRLRPGTGMSPQFVALQLHFLWMSGYFLHRCTHHVNQASVSSSVLAETVPLIVAPSREQSRIVAEIEKQFTRLDTAVAALKRVQVNLKRYRAAVLKAACEGHLVPTEAELARKEDRSYETGEQLLARILKERRAKWEADQLTKMHASGKPPKTDDWKKKYKEAEPPKLDDSRTLPEGWTWTNLGQLSWSVKDGPHYSPKYSDAGIPFITGGQVRPSGIDFTAAKYISPELHGELIQRCRPQKGDLLYTKGGTTGIARVNTYDTEFSVWVHVAVLKLVDSVPAFYVQHALNSPPCYAQSQRFTHGVGNQDLGLTRMVWIAFGLPPLAEQKRIIDEVDRRLSEIDDIEKSLASGLARADRLRQSILKRAFEGKLVPQDPNDEPASALLERIRAERTANANDRQSFGRRQSSRRSAASTVEAR